METPKCMEPKCGKEWTRHFLAETMTQNFLTTRYKEHVERLLFDKERALLPATQAKAEEIMETRRLSAELQEHEKRRQMLQKEYDSLSKATHCMYVVFQNCLAYDMMTSDDKRHHNETAIRMENRKKEIYPVIQMEKAKSEEVEVLMANVSKKERRVKERQYRCSEATCRGFVDSKGHCGLCDQLTCQQCRHPKTKDHECDPQEVATIQLLANDSKGCPSCATLIFKIDGCDQMWCTQCHTAFSWRTGAVETRIHNPHYFEWQRTRGTLERNPLDIECGREMDHRLAGGIGASLRLRTGLDPSLTQTISKIISTTLHVREVEMPAYRVDAVEDNEPMRLAYLLKDIDDRTFRIQLQQANKRHKKNREFSEILQMYTQCITDIVFRFIDLMKKTKCDSRTNIIGKPDRRLENESFMELLNEVPGLVSYTNVLLARVAKDYQCVQKVIKDPSLCVQNREIFTTVQKPKTAVAVAPPAPAQVIDLL
jgi:hypothetical protein